MKRVLFFISMLSTLEAVAQPYTYKPLALDTSCFWSSEFLFYDGGYVCRGERLSAVTGDTLIGGQQYFRIWTYTTEFPHPEVPMCNQGYLSLDVVTLLREDTAARKLYYSSGSVAIDFNLQVGDTLLKTSPGSSSYASIVDSINIQNFLGVDRKVQWATPAGTNGFRYQSIEGIGMNYNFPVRDFGEWGIPVYRLQCYSKGGQTLYTNGSTVNCIRKPRASLGIKKVPQLSRSAFSLDGNKISILNSELLPLTMQVFDMAGRLLRTTTLTNSDALTLDLITGAYVLRLSKREQMGTYLIYVP